MSKKINFDNLDQLRQKSSYRSPLMSSLRKAPLCPEIVATSSGNKKTWDNWDLNATNHFYMDWLVQLSNFKLAISILGLEGGNGRIGEKQKPRNKRWNIVKSHLHVGERSKTLLTSFFSSPAFYLKPVSSHESKSTWFPPSPAWWTNTCTLSSRI